MKVSTRVQYGVRLMFELSLSYEKGPMLLRDIARREEISEKYLSQIIIPLKTAGLVNSNRGAHGGYILARPPAKISLKEIVEVLEGNITLVECVRNPSVCRRVSVCVSRNIWATLEKKISQTLDSLTLEDLVRMYREKEEPLMYNI